jgi:hypothetical protein
MKRKLIDWLLEGDPAIRFQTCRDLLGEERPELQRSITEEGWGAAFLSRRNPDGSWGRGFYQPKWTSSHYTLLDIRLLEPVPDHPVVRESIRGIVRRHKGKDGGIDPSITVGVSDVCVNGMFLNYACYFGEDETELRSVIDFLLSQRMADGGFNCESNRSGARHGSLHSTISVLEGIEEYRRAGYRYRIPELEDCAAASREFLLRHRLFKSDRTGEVIKPEFLKLFYPPRWKYTILRALDFFRRADCPRDDRMEDAFAVLLRKRRSDGRWRLQAPLPGQVHFSMEKPGQPSRWITLIALRVLRAYGRESEEETES